jgi:small subunit ribosomal protein S1
MAETISYSPGNRVLGRVERKVKGGWAVRLSDGTPAFLPASQTWIRPNTESPTDFVGQIIEAEVLTEKPLLVKRAKTERHATEVVLSRRRILLERAEERKKNCLERLQSGHRIQGKVSGIQGYGIFIDLGGIDGLLHVSKTIFANLSKSERERALKTSYPAGTEVAVEVESVDLERERIEIKLAV